MYRITFFYNLICFITLDVFFYKRVLGIFCLKLQYDGLTSGNLQMVAQIMCAREGKQALMIFFTAADFNKFFTQNRLDQFTCAQRFMYYHLVQKPWCSSFCPRMLFLFQFLHPSVFSGNFQFGDVLWQSQLFVPVFIID